MKCFTYFGYIETDFDPNRPYSRHRMTKVKIVDNLSSKVIEFTLPATVVEQVGATEQFVLLLDDAREGSIWLYDLKKGELFCNYLGLPSESGREGRALTSPLIFDLIDDINISIGSILSDKTNEEEGNDSIESRLETQFSHWANFEKQVRCSLPSPPARRLLACTAFGAFIASNFRDLDVTLCSVLRCIFLRESRLFDDDSEAESEKNKNFLSAVKLPFHVRKMTAGHDHLALMNPQGNVYTLGTGTRGELGHGCVEQGKWSGEPKIVADLSDAGIRVVDLSSGPWHMVALTDESDLYGWGWNGHGQLGIPAEQCTIQPIPHPFDLADMADEEVKSIECVGDNTFVHFSNGEIRCFGKDAKESEEMEGQEKEEEGVIESTSSFSGNKNKNEEGENASELLKLEADGEQPEFKRSRQQRLLRLAVAGCSHGQMDAIYERLTEIERQRNAKFDLLICCGDFQSIRNHGDLHYFHAPPHHRKLGTFYKYYSGEKIAPVLTLFVGGNHESSGYLAELPNGGWVAPNIWYMGYASVVQFAGLRIVGLSGIYKSQDYHRGHFERPPFQEYGSIVSAYHVRSVDIFRLKQLRDSQIDICVSHDWPAGITDFGDCERLLRIKPHFTEDIRNNRLGNPATMTLLYELKPSHWFSAHMHVRFTAIIPHGNTNRNEKGGEMAQTKVTRFLALDKPVGDSRRRFLEFIDLPIDEDASMNLCYDPAWLAILRSTDHLTKFTEKNIHFPDERKSMGSDSSLADRHDFRPTSEELEAVNKLFAGDFRVPLNFQRTAPIEFEPFFGRGKHPIRPASLYYRNPQSQLFCERLGIRDLNFMFAQAAVGSLGIPYFLSENNSNLPTKETGKEETTKNGGESASDKKNPEEIDLGEEDEFGDADFIVDVRGSGTISLKESDDCAIDSKKENK